MGKDRFNWFYFFVIGWLFLLVYDFTQYKRNMEAVPYSQFLSYVDHGQVDRVAVGNEKIEGLLKNPPAPGKSKEFTTTKMEDPALTDRLVGANVQFTAVHESTFFKDLLS